MILITKSHTILLSPFGILSLENLLTPVFCVIHGMNSTHVHVLKFAAYIVIVLPLELELELELVTKWLLNLIHTHENELLLSINRF